MLPAQMSAVLSPSSLNRKRAFTLIELMVVVALIAILGGLLIAALGASNHSSKVVKDLTQIRSLQRASIQYSLANYGDFIEVGLSHGDLPDAEVAWVNTLSSFYDSPLVVESPLDDSPHWPIPIGAGVPIEGTENKFRKTSYGCNNYLTEFSPDAAIDQSLAVDKMSKVKAPSKLIHFLTMAYEGDFAGADHVHVENWWLADFAPNFPPKKASEEVQTNSVKGMKSTWEATSNYGFVDGHVETLSFGEIYKNLTKNKFNPSSFVF